MEPPKALLIDLLKIPGVCGFEEPVRREIAEWIKPLPGNGREIAGVVGWMPPHLIKRVPGIPEMT